MIHFVGAGPGAPDLITLRGAKLLGEAGMIIYAGSLVNPELLKLASAGCEIYNSASMTLDEVIEKLKSAHERGLDGIIAIGVYQNEFFDQLGNTDIPIVIIDSYDIDSMDLIKDYDMRPRIRLYSKLLPLLRMEFGTQSKTSYYAFFFSDDQIHASYCPKDLRAPSESSSPIFCSSSWGCSSRYLASLRDLAK